MDYDKILEGIYEEVAHAKALKRRAGEALAVRARARSAATTVVVVPPALARCAWAVFTSTYCIHWVWLRMDPC